MALSDVELMQRFLEGDEDAFAIIVHRYECLCFCQVNCEPIFDRNSHQFQREAGKRRNEKGTILQLKSEPTFIIGINDN